MKTIIALFLVVFTSSSFAATRKQINQKATKLLINNITSLAVESTEISRSDVIGHVFNKTTTFSTVCKYDRGDEMYDCKTDAVNKLEETALRLEYQLEGQAGQLPTEFLFYNVTVSVAG